MFIFPLPTGHLVSRCSIRRGRKTQLEWTLVAGIIGGIFPNVDLSITINTRSRPSPTTPTDHTCPMLGRASDC